MLNNEIGSQLKNLRESKGLTIERVAYAVDETPSEVEFWESGKLKPCADAKRKLEFLFSCFGDDHKELAKVMEHSDEPSAPAVVPLQSEVSRIFLQFDCNLPRVYIKPTALVSMMSK